MSNFFPLFSLYFIQLHFPRSFQRIIFFSRSFARSFFLYFNVNKFVLCEYYIICQTYSVIQFVHTEFYFVARCLCVCVSACCCCYCCFCFCFNLLFSVSIQRNLEFSDEQKRKRNKKLENANEQKCLEKGKCSLAYKQTPNKYWNINVPVVNDFLLRCVCCLRSRTRTQSSFSLWVVVSWWILSYALHASHAVV